MTVHGTARFATRGELRADDLLEQWKPGEPTQGLMVGWWYENEYDFQPITYDGDLHQLIVGGIGGGKFTTALAPMLLGSHLDDSTVVVVDPKGEIAQIIGPFFQKAFAEKPNVFLLDPWDICGTGASSRLNVLEEINPNNPNYVDDARALADAIIIPSGSENTHWDNAARNFLTAIILYVALDPEEKDNRDLVRVRDLITQSWAMPKAYPAEGPKRPTLSQLLFKHLTSELADGAVRRGFSSLLNREDKERSGIISSIERDTAWIDSPPMAKVLKGPSLDLKQAALGGGKYFIVLPDDYFRTHRAWLRLMVTAFAKAMKRHRPNKSRPNERRWRHIVIDEFTTLGEMSSILHDIAVARGFDIKFHLGIQDLNQLEREYGKTWPTFTNNSFQRVFSVNDLTTTKHISEVCGVGTVESISRSWGRSRTQTRSSGMSTTESSGTSTPPGIFRFSTHTSGASQSLTTGHSDSTGYSTSETTSLVQRPVLTADEVRRLSKEDQLIIMPGQQAIRSWRPPYWDVFRALPPFGLKEILGTVGRAPKDEAERAYFEGWRPSPFLIRPPERPLPPPPVLPLPRPPDPPLNWRTPLAVCAVIAALILTWWALPSTPKW